MKTNFLTFMGLLIIITIIATGRFSAITPTESATDLADLWFEAATFEPGIADRIVVTGEGLELEALALSGVYLSPVLEAPIFYNAVVPQWIAHLPEGSDMAFSLRTGNSEGEWSPWYEIHAQPDWMVEGEPDVVGEMITVSESDGRHQYIQFSVAFSRSIADLEPLLSQLRLTFIDSTAGPTAEEMVAQQQALDAASGTQQTADGYPKPFVVSRQVWCTHADCNYSDGLQYRSVSHLLLHHTVSSNSSSDWAAVVRAIWSFHTYTRGWGDIGYNYLVDMNGVLYEGHLGGDDVKGTHAAGANLGSMALALIGNFVSDMPPPPMLNSAAELFSWKADQKGIDVYDASSSLPDIAWGLPHLMGHRDVYGGTNTQCPGEVAHELLPALRDEIAARIGLASPHIYIDELSGAFTKSNNNWYEGAGNCGNQGHAYYTWSTTDPAASVNWGEWRPSVPARGYYKIEVYAPYCTTGRAETDGARYTIHHAGGVSQVTVSHDDNVGLWMSLGVFDLLAGNNSLIRLTDLTTTDSGLGVWFDAIRLTPLEPQAPSIATLGPLANAWLTEPEVSFNWEITSPWSVQGTTLQVATDAGFTNLVLTKNWSGVATSYNHSFSEDYQNLYWQVQLSTDQWGSITSEPSRFGLDMTPPTSAVVAVAKFDPDSSDYWIFWQGQDVASGVAGYNIDYQAAGGAWTRWLTDTASRGASFTPPTNGEIYGFRSQAVDLVGHLEPVHSSADITTDETIFLTKSAYMPLIRR